MVAVAGVDAAPMIDDDVRAECADHPDHVFQDLAIPDFFRLFGSFGKAEIASPREIKFHAITSSGREKFLRADQTKLRSLFGTESVLSAFAASKGEKRDIGVKAASEIGEDGGGFIVRVSGYIKDARGDASAVDSFDGFGKPGPVPGAGGNWAAKAAERQHD